MQFENRSHAGQLLAHQLREYINRPEVVVLALPRGGVLVAYEIAKVLNAPLDIMVVRKLGVPGQEELAMGAIASGGIRVLNMPIVRALHLSEEVITGVVATEEQELIRREELYRSKLPPLEVQGRTVILVDDGLATGTSMRVAVAALRQRHPAKLIIAVPVAPLETWLDFENVADQIVCLLTPESFFGIGEWYHDFRQTSDAEVCALLKQAAKRNWHEPINLETVTNPPAY
jgi:putative phosphoribosyl transferase